MIRIILITGASSGIGKEAAKHTLEGWSDCLRLELKAFNINVVILEPGLIQTEFAKVLDSINGEIFGKWCLL